jgi:hypothetical protein
LGLATLMYGLVQAGDYGWGSSDAIIPSRMSRSSWNLVW